MDECTQHSSPDDEMVSQVSTQDSEAYDTAATTPRPATIRTPGSADEKARDGFPHSIACSIKRHKRIKTSLGVTMRSSPRRSSPRRNPPSTANSAQLPVQSPSCRNPQLLPVPRRTICNSPDHGLSNDLLRLECLLGIRRFQPRLRYRRPPHERLCLSVLGYLANTTATYEERDLLGLLLHPAAETRPLFPFSRSGRDGQHGSGAASQRLEEGKGETPLGFVIMDHKYDSDDEVSALGNENAVEPLFTTP